MHFSGSIVFLNLLPTQDNWESAKAVSHFNDVLFVDFSKALKLSPVWPIFREPQGAACRRFFDAEV